MAVKTKKGSEAPEELETPSGGLLDAPEPGTEVFGGEGQKLTVTKDVNAHQLMEEVYDRLGDRDKYQVAAVLEDDYAPVSEENPLVLYVLGDADMKAVEDAVEQHEKDEHWGLSEEEQKINDLKARLKDGEDLPTADLNTLLRAIVS